MIIENSPLMYSHASENTNQVCQPADFITPRSVTIRAFCAALLLATATADRLTAAETVEIANPTLSVVLAIPDGRLTVTDRRCDMVWRQHVPVQTAQGSDWGKNVRTNRVGANRLLRIERASVEERTIHAAASWSGHPFSIRFELPEEGAELTVVIDTPSPKQRVAVGGRLGGCRADDLSVRFLQSGRRRHGRAARRGRGLLA